MDEENPGKCLLGDRLIKAVRTFIASIRSLTSKWLGETTHHVNGKKKRKQEYDNLSIVFNILTLEDLDQFALTSEL